MTKRTLLQPNESYTFRSYFEFNADTDEILAELGYGLEVKALNLPQDSALMPALDGLRSRIERSLTLVPLSNETARREVLVSPILLEVASYYNAKLRIEYPLNFNDRLRGNLDYLLRCQNTLAVIEAKRDDLARGFTQLAAELIAIAELEELPFVYGAVTLGDVWRFGRCDRGRAIVEQDINLYTVPGNLNHLTQILGGILIHTP
ncbi:MAG: hypothetical protein MH825_15495 [Cyanobacteria bacterium]|nr:hypothetical protein [Cyanobacteriota bacterium]